MAEQMERAGLRFRAAVVEYFGLVVAALVVLALVGGVVTLNTYGSEQTRTETREVSSWRSSGSFAHSATVTNGTAAFAEGTVLRNRSAYFVRASPVLNGSFRYTYSATGSGDLSAATRLVLVMRSIEETEQGGIREYWRVERTLGNRTVDSLSPGERVSVPFSTNVSRASRRAGEIDRNLGGSPGETQILVVARTSVSGTRNGQSVDRERTYRLELDTGTAVYRVQQLGNATHSGAQTRQVQIPVEPGPLRAVGAPLLAALTLLGLVALAAGRATDRLALTADERELLAYRSARSEFDDWITAVATAPDRPGDERVTVESLRGLVDLAIDTDNRVLEDRERERYVVLADERVYEYQPPADALGGADEEPLAPDAGGTSAPDAGAASAPDPEDGDGADPDEGDPSATDD